MIEGGLRLSSPSPPPSHEDNLYLGEALMFLHPAHSRSKSIGKSEKSGHVERGLRRRDTLRECKRFVTFRADSKYQGDFVPGWVEF